MLLGAFIGVGPEVDNYRPGSRDPNGIDYVDFLGREVNLPVTHANGVQHALRIEVEDLISRSQSKIYAPY